MSAPILQNNARWKVQDQDFVKQSASLMEFLRSPKITYVTDADGILLVCAYFRHRTINCVFTWFHNQIKVSGSMIGCSLGKETYHAINSLKCWDKKIAETTIYEWVYIPNMRQGE